MSLLQAALQTFVLTVGCLPMGAGGRSYDPGPQAVPLSSGRSGRKQVTRAGEVLKHFGGRCKSGVMSIRLPKPKRHCFWACLALKMMNPHEVFFGFSDIREST